MTIRTGRPGDEHELADLHIVSWQVGYAEIFPSDFLASLDRSRRVSWWRDFMEAGRVVHVAVVDDQVVGFCHADESDDGGWGEVHAIYVHPEHWGQGHGHRLMLAGEDWLRQLGFERALLWVLEDNERGRSFYERQGWKRGRPYRLEDIGGTQVGEVRYESEL